MDAKSQVREEKASERDETALPMQPSVSPTQDDTSDDLHDVGLQLRLGVSHGRSASPTPRPALPPRAPGESWRGGGDKRGF